MINPWVLLGVVLLWTASLVGVGRWQRHDATEIANAACLADKNADLKADKETITVLQNQRRDTERAHVEETNRLATELTGALNENRDLKARDADRARTGALSLRVPTKCSDPRGEGHPTAAPARAAAAGDAADTGTAELPRQVTEDLFALANDADAVVKRYNKCIDLAESDRKEKP